jgi:act minimal PKS acyl carrier protein
MRELTIDDLKRIMRSCGGEDESVDFGGDIRDISFVNLGYDSLALLEAAAVVQREYGVIIGDGDLPELQTPRAFLQKVNTLLVGEQSVGG